MRAPSNLAMKADAESESEQCVVCTTRDDNVYLWCNHVICIQCASKAHEFGHRQCPICRIPHLLDVPRLRANALRYRKGYNNWRRGGADGSAGEIEDVTGFAGWRLLRTIQCHSQLSVRNEQQQTERYSKEAGLLFIASMDRAVEAQLASQAEKLRVSKLENELAALKQQLEEVRAERSDFRWADAEPGGRLAETLGSPRSGSPLSGSPRSSVAPRRTHARPPSRRHIFGTEQPCPKLSPAQVADRTRLIGQQVRVLDGPDTNLRGELLSISRSGYAVIKPNAPRDDFNMPSRIASSQARFQDSVKSRCVYSSTIAPVQSQL